MLMLACTRNEDLPAVCPIAVSHEYRVARIGRVISTIDSDGPQPGDVIVRIDPRYFRPNYDHTRKR